MAEDGKNSDNWKHRSSEMRCGTCMYFVMKIIDPTTGFKPSITERGGLGRCRRCAPTMKGFPAVFQGDWCGDHKIDENKIS